MNRYYRRSTCCAVPRYQTPGRHSYHLCRFLRFSQVLLRPVRGLPSGKESLSPFWKGTVIHVQGNESIDCFMRALVCLICYLFLSSSLSYFSLQPNSAVLLRVSSTSRVLNIAFKRNLFGSRIVLTGFVTWGKGCRFQPFCWRDLEYLIGLSGQDKASDYVAKILWPKVKKYVGTIIIVIKISDYFVKISNMPERNISKGSLMTK